MAENKRGFSPFNLNSSIEALIEGRAVKSGWFSSKVDFPALNNKLSKQGKGKTYSSASQKLIKLFFDTTEEILTSKFGLKN